MISHKKESSNKVNEINLFKSKKNPGNLSKNIFSMDQKQKDEKFKQLMSGGDTKKQLEQLNNRVK